MNIDKKVDVKHSVLCITYNQESYIEKAISTLFEGTVHPYEVIVFDDCSSDATYEKLLALQNKFGSVLKIIRNENNLGIFKNLNQIKSHPTGDIIHLLAGDDWFEPGMFEEMNNLIKKKDLNPKNERFAIVCESFAYRNETLNRIAIKKSKIIKLYKSMLRRELYYMPVGLSAAYFKTYPTYKTDIGLWADYVHTVLFTRNCEQLYFLDAAYPVYREGVGVSSKSNEKTQYQSFLKSTELLLSEHLEILDNDDISYLNYSKDLYSFLIDKKLTSLVKVVVSFIININNGAKIRDLKLVFNKIIN